MEKVFFINYFLHRPRLSNVSGRYEMLSDSFYGDMVAICPGGETDVMLGSFRFRGIPYFRKVIIHHLMFIYYVLLYGLRSNGEEKISVIVAYDPLICGISGYILKLLTGARFVVEVNGDIIDAGFMGELNLLRRFKKRLVVFLTKFILDRADRIKYLNSEIAEKYSRITRNDNHRVFLNFVPTYLFREGDARFDRYILFVGFPFHLKGVDILINAFKMVSPRHEDFQLKIIGYCPDPAPYREMIKDNDHIIIQEPVFYDKIVEEFRNCYCFVLPSRSEGMGRVLIEAMASGKPVIGSKVGGIPSLINDGESGFLFESENVSELAEKLEILMADEELARNMGENALEHVDTHLSASIYTQKYKEFLSELF